MACKVGLEEVVCPSFDMGILFSATDIDKFSIPVLEDNWTKLITKRFVFNGDAISKLKAKVMASSGSATKRHPSRVEVVTACIWKARMRVAQAKHGHSRPSLLTLAYNFRGKTSLRIPENAFGNVFKLILAKYKPTDTKFEFPDFKQMADSQLDSKLFSVRIVSIDHYMAPPIPDYDFCYSNSQGDKVHEVPIIRVHIFNTSWSEVYIE
ncbi:hypothetical protein EZV62_006762 [Acer yangbiense]|uniref:DNA polymerase zeta catalytic subunit N-terminal domain-containing protein n=1 Tax=Acer yangbiense TaxID=1000413 RepID=A0A5C7I8K8_9ROSI|nr:hypothetical protein EZV62_006762 [Acer yangbiense]